MEKSYTTDEIYDIADNMENYGGAFVKRLGAALRYADFHNKIKLAESFPEYFEEYLNWNKYK